MENINNNNDENLANRWSQFTIARFLLLILFLTLLSSLLSSFAFALTIGSNTVTPLDAATADVNFITDEPTIAFVNYGIDPTLGQQAADPSNPQLRASHAIRLSNLNGGQQYFFNVLVANSMGETIIDDNHGQLYTFVAQAPGAPVPAAQLAISNVRVNTLGPSTTVINWETNLPATAKVYYGRDGSTNQTQQRQTPATSHSIVLQTQSGVVYTFYVESCVQQNCVSTETNIDSFVGGSQSALPLQFQVNATIPEVASSASIDIPVFTLPFVRIDLFVNGFRTRTSSPSETGSVGTVTFYGVSLQRDQTNQIRIVASDASGSQAEITGSVLVDTTPPTLSIDPLPSAVQDFLAVAGNVSEPVTIKFSTRLRDAPALPIITNVRTTDNPSQNEVDLEWDLNQAFTSYAIYANDILVGESTQEQFTFRNGAPGATIAFSVAGVTQECIQGSKSPAMNVVFDGSGGTLGTLTPIQLSCERGENVIQAQGRFSHQVNLFEGANIVTITAKDVAGNDAVVVAEVLYDTQAPQFIMDDTNIDDVSPVYDDVVKIKGKISEPGAIYFYLNDDIDQNNPTMIVPTDNDGYFEADVQLIKDPGIFQAKIPGATGVGSAANAGWINRLKLKAVDNAGFETETNEYPIIYAKCGYGGAFSVTVDPPSRAVHPDEVADGTAEVYFNLHLRYNGQETFRVGSQEYPRYRILQNPALHVPLLSKEEEAQLEQVKQVGAPRVIWDRAFKNGVASISVNGYNFGDVNPEDLSREEKLDMISNTNKGTCLYGLAGDLYGCIKVPLELEIRYLENRPAAQAQGAGVASQTGVGGKVTGDYYSEERIEKICYPKFEVAIDKYEGFNIPEGFLKSTTEFLDDTISVIDTILKPIETVEQLVFYSWAASWIYYGVNTWNVEKDCISGNIIKVFAGGDPFDIQIAKAGLCKKAYTANPDQVTACQQCSKSLLKQQRTKLFQNYLGDRLACPPAPSLQNYIKMKQGEESEALLVGGADIFVDSSCADPNSVTANYDGVKKIYEGYKKQQGNRKSGGDKAKLFEITDGEINYDSQDPNCYGLHPSNVACCGVEYTQQWGSACLLMDELKESLCLAAQNENVVRQEAALPEGVRCGRLFNSIAGFCEPGTGQMPPNWIPTGLALQGVPTEDVAQRAVAGSGRHPARRPSSDNGTDYDTQGIVPPYVKDRDMYIRVMRLNDKNKITQEQGTLSVYRGYMYNTLTGSVGPNNPRGENTVQDTRKFHPQIELSKYFIGDNINKGLFQSGFKKALCKGVKPTSCTDKVAEDIFNRIKQESGVAYKPYIVEPASSLLRSAQCACLGGVHESLKVWKGRLTAVNSCFKQVELTGEGSPGSCQEVLGKNICDVVVDMLRCFVQKFGVSKGARVGGPVVALETIFNRLVYVGNSIKDSVSERYGGTAFYRNLFVEKKLVNSICLFAFTGTFDLDINSLITSSVNDIPVDSQPLIFRSQREFLNPGLAGQISPAFRYTVAYSIVAGADITYNLRLVCSDDYSCRDNPGGKCDCAGKHARGQGRFEISMPLQTSGSLQKGEIDDQVLEETYQEPVRFDKVILEYQYVNNAGEFTTRKIEKKIGQTGTAPPSYCRWEISLGEFVCQFGDVAGEEWAKFRNDPTPNYKQGKNLFILNEPIEFNINLQQHIPQGRSCPSQSCEFTKYLVWEIYNQFGARVATNLIDIKDPRLALNNDGEHVFTDIPGGALTLNPTWFNINPADQQQVVCDPRTPSGRQVYHFDAIFKIYDATRQQNGAGYVRSGAVTIFNAEEQKKTIQFDVVCATSWQGQGATATGGLNIIVWNSVTGQGYTPGAIPANQDIKIRIYSQTDGALTKTRYDNTNLVFSAFDQQSTEQPFGWKATVNSGAAGQHTLHYTFTPQGQAPSEGDYPITIGAQQTSPTGAAVLGWDDNTDCLKKRNCEDYFYWIPIHGWNEDEMPEFRRRAEEESKIIKTATKFSSRRTGFFFITLSQMSVATECSTVLRPELGNVITNIERCANVIRNTLPQYRKVFGLSARTSQELDLVNGGNMITGFAVRNLNIIFITRNADEGTGAHEFGHTFGLCDVYDRTEWQTQNSAALCPNLFPTNCGQASICQGWNAELARSSELRSLAISGICTADPYYDFMGNSVNNYCGYHQPDYDLIIP